MTSMHYPIEIGRYRAAATAVVASLLLTSALCNFSSTHAMADSPAAQPQASPATEFHVDLKKTLEFLAADEQEGRGVGTEGLNHAADQIADDFRKLGLQTVPGVDGYFQPFQMTTSVKPDDSTSLEMTGKQFKLNVDFVPTSFSGEGTIDGPVAFAGYGITSKKYNYDDYANIDVKGKIVIALRYEPHNEKGTSRFVADGWSDEAPLFRKAQNAAKHGATAFILVNPPTFHPGDLLASFGGADKAAIPFLHVHIAAIDEILKAGGLESLKQLQAGIDKEAKPASTLLQNVTLKGLVKLRREKKEVKNVLAMKPGYGELASEYIVVGAHYDHLGYGGPGSLAPGSKAIHHGADDNASGTTAMLGVADRFAHQALPSDHSGSGARNIIFIAFTGEEEGLIGSAHFVSHPPVPLDHIAAMLNLDMVGRVRNNVLYLGGAGTAPSFDQFLKDAMTGTKLTTKSFGRGGMGPSDHMSFALKKVPVLFLFSGMHADYHRPTDTADKINFQGMDEVVELAEKLATKMRTMPREKYVDAADKDSMMSPTAHASGSSQASLGIVPDYSAVDDQTKGVKISGTSPGSGAEKAGLRSGDVIVQWNQNKVESLQQLSNYLSTAKPGDTVKLSVERDGKRIELEATLHARQSG